MVRGSIAGLRTSGRRNQVFVAFSNGGDGETGGIAVFDVEVRGQSPNHISDLRKGR